MDYADRIWRIVWDAGVNGRAEEALSALRAGIDEIIKVADEVGHQGEHAP